ncbi:MAG: DUF4956 domain-containing protein [Lachnospiraceae bacterium]|nr:DUF4956 domain-containing protein [Lachnospiraceae bacterium]
MFNSIISTELTVESFFICMAVSLVLGIATSIICMFKGKSSQSFLITLALIPAIVQVIIMLVNGNIGASVAVAGAFSLVRFRSAPGTAKEIGAIFLAMTIGLATGMGYVTLAVAFFLVIAIAMFFLTAVNFGKESDAERTLKITIPEGLDYDGLFDDLFAKYTKESELERVKTTNMGTLFELQYRIRLRGTNVPKEFIDDLRCRNGNLNIVCSKVVLKDAL